MKKENDLKHINSSLIDIYSLFPSNKAEEQKALESFLREIIALYRINKIEHHNFLDFYLWIKNIFYTSNNPEIYRKLYDYLKNTFNDEPRKKCKDFLRSKGYPIENLHKIVFSQDEETLRLNLYSLNRDCLNIIYFYLYQPNIVTRYFIKNPDFFLNSDEQVLLKNFRSLNPELQKRTLSYMQTLSDAERMNGQVFSDIRR